MSARTNALAGEPPVTVTDKGAFVLVENGIVALEIGKANARPMLRFQGKNIFGSTGYLNWHAEDEDNLDQESKGKRVSNNETYNTLAKALFTQAIDPKTNGGELADVRFAQKFPGNGPPFDVELHYVLRRGDSGFYNYAVFSHPQAYPTGQLSQARMLFRVNEDILDFMTIDEARRRFMPPPNTPYKPMGPKEAMLMTEGPFKGVIEDKYHNFADAGDHFVHGWAGSKSRVGCWIIYGSNEDVNGGPTKQYNTAHFPQVLMRILTCGHYGSAPVAVGREAWQKIYGPWFVYVNAGANQDALWADAKRRTAAERAASPYAWLRHPLYPPAAERAELKGQFRIADTQDPKASAAHAWVGLAAAKPDWQQQSLGYQFWVRADADGRFTIPKVRPGEYTLYAFVEGVMDEFRRGAVTLAPGATTDLGTLEWKPPHYGRLLWQIGTPDRTAKEFRHGDDYRQWGLWLKYAQEFPHDVNFRIGSSHERTDWNFAQCAVERGGDYVGTKWNVLFDVPTPQRGAATLRIGLAAAHKAALRVYVNDKSIGSNRVDTDNALMRAGIHGQYTEWNLQFDAALLKPGPNTLTLEQQGGKSPSRNVMYDCVRLEVLEAK